jgi:site-specific DNA-methyltransferase (adenine-specific)
MLDEQSGKTETGSFKKAGYRQKYPENLYQLGISKKEGALKYAPDNYGDTGGASRFFYTAKADRSERNIGCEGFEEKQVSIQVPNNSKRTMGAMNVITKNNHPTVKPLKLMEYLCTLTKTPTGGIVLDPFLGSGTTAMAARRTLRNFIGIEISGEYCDIARKRLSGLPIRLDMIRDDKNGNQ